MRTEAVQNGMTWVTTLNIRWEPRLVVSWMRGDIAWAQIRIDGHTIETLSQQSSSTLRPGYSSARATAGPGCTGVAVNRKK
jgi:hypothetical protein